MEINVTAQNFEKVVLQSERPVLIDFWATWCPPCRMLGPVVAAIAEERDDILVCKVNSDENQALCMKFGVSSIPALFLLKDGKVLDSSVGYRDKNALLRWIDSVI
ncbi:MAG: thioredoxin [Clostridia bacterium]|nr:thioredoxin [Clostridia bacterium]MBQ4396986.1 thioredoxin [Clostridia bacterium]MBQ5545840.1 thioredoxin [Clostridia bacterium]